MSRKIHKISELEKLQAKKARLLIDAKLHAKALDQHVDYVQDHFGDLLLNTVKGAIVPKLPPLVRNFLPASFETTELAEHHDEAKSKTSMVVDQLLDFAPLLFKGAKPVVIAFLLKKAKEMIFKKKK